MEPRHSNTAGERETVIGEGVAASSDDDVLVSGEGVAVSSDDDVLVFPAVSVADSEVVIPNVMASESGNVTASWSVMNEAGRTINEDSNRENINIYTISRLGGGAALGAVVGTWIFPGAGSLAGAAVGGALGAFAPSILLRVKSGDQRDGGADTPAQ